LRLNFVHSGEVGLRVIQAGIVTGERELNLDAVGKPLEKNLEARSGGL
jgi:hypothetical protein